MIFEGRGSRALFLPEAGGHRWQRIPPTEKRGRVHTSTITVAVLDPLVADRYELDMREVDIRKTLGSGPGGQHRNKTESCVIATHRPTGMMVRVDMRSQPQSLAMALRILSAKLADIETELRDKGRNAERRAQVGSGMRGDKIRTYREQDDRVTDHRSGSTFRLSLWMRGDWSEGARA
ncbi:MAG: PCRF domain-containing protein [Polyangiaceae bacterium]|nr:PCRF domain-containing protein [Polyangiaceae bacterium]